VNSQKSVLRMFSSVSLVSRKEREQLESLEKELYGVRDNQAALIEIKMRSLHQKKISETLLTEFMELEIEIQAIIHKGPDIVRTNLETAVRSNLLLEVAIFLRHSADVNALDSRGRGYLEMSPSLQMGNLLIEYGYDFNRTPHSGITILHLSVGCAHIDVVRMLLETEGMDVMAKTDYLLSTPLHGCNHPRIAELLLSHGADPNALNAFGETPLLTITTCGDWQTYLLLILAGGDWTRASSENITPV
jgi:ankyrin repeat protein